MYLRLLFSQVLLLLMVENSRALSCLPCFEGTCPEPQCPGGKVLGPCGCCYVCAKQKDETCGGPFYTTGKCDEGLKCVTRHQPYIVNTEGVCKEKQLTDDEEFMAWLDTRLNRRRAKHNSNSDPQQ